MVTFRGDNMTKISKDYRLQHFFETDSKWQDAFILFREIILTSDLTEDFKWMHPCYTFNGKNVLLMHGFKDYVALLFHKGVLIEDKFNMLVQQTENVQSARQLRFSNIAEIESKVKEIEWYINEAIKIEAENKKIEKKPVQIKIPQELSDTFAKDSIYEMHFNQLTPGRQRAYIIEINKAKKSETRQRRIDKYREKILQGKGLTER